MLMPTASLANVTVEAFQPILYLVMRLNHLLHSCKLDVVMVFLQPAQGPQLTDCIICMLYLLRL